ncbi:MAG: CheR family methyltransferase [Paracoccaceae bacterium]
MNAHLDQKHIHGEMSAKVFREIALIAHREAGLVISESKMAMVKSRITRRLRALALPDYETYLALVNSPDGAAEMPNFISALTTNVSHFFREGHHFDLLKNTILPPLLKKAANGGRIRIWSAGCSNGQEPYSIAMTLLSLDPKAFDKDIRILATDIDPEVIAHARAGLYPKSMATGLEPEHISAFFESVQQNGELCHSALEPLRKLVSFRRLNLHEKWPMNGKFDVIFCRNVVIYFDEATQAVLYKNFANALGSEGWLLLGHSERITDNVSGIFETAGVTAYRPVGSSKVDSALKPNALMAKGA